MTRAVRSAHRRRACQQALAGLAACCPQPIDLLDEGQRWVLFAVLQILPLLQSVPLLRQVLGYLLCHCGMDLHCKLIAAVLQTAPRSLSRLRSETPAQVLTSLRRRKRQPTKLRPEHAGPLARFLFVHPHASAQDTLQFVQTELKLEVERHTLTRFLSRYGLGGLRDLHAQAASPFLASPSTAAPSC